MESSKANSNAIETAEASAPAARRSEPLWPSHQRCVDLPAGRTCYVEAGAGFPLVLIHGLMGYSFSWRKNLGVLQEHFRVLALDLAGCGHSGPLQIGKYGVAGWSQQLREFLDALGLAKVHLVGTSAGGAVALEFASRFPERVERMALTAPVTPFSRRAVWLAKLYRLTGMPAWALRLLLKQMPHLLPWLFRHRYYAAVSRITPETIPGYLEGIRQETMVRLLQEAVRGWKSSQAVPQFAQLQAPVLLLWGDQDKIVPPTCLARLSKALPHCTVKIVADAGHFCYEEHPQQFNEAILRFLLKTPQIR